MLRLLIAALLISACGAPEAPDVQNHQLYQHTIECNGLDAGQVGQP